MIRWIEHLEAVICGVALYIAVRSGIGAWNILQLPITTLHVFLTVGLILVSGYSVLLALTAVDRVKMVRRYYDAVEALRREE